MAFIGNQPISAAFLTDTFSGNGSTVAFTMTVAPANTSSIIVAVTGVLQDPSTYSVSGTTLTFSAAPPSGTSNISVRYLGIPASGVTTTAYRTVTNFTATAGQTSFTIPSYTVGYVDVYRNGVRLVSTDFTATTGTTVVLANACTVGDAVVTESFYVSSVLNAIANSPASVSSSNLAALSTIPSTAGNITVPAVTGTMMVSGNQQGFSAYLSANQSITASTFTKAQFNTTEFNLGSAYDATTNYRFTPTVAGYYQVNLTIYTSGTGSTQANAYIYKNGASFKSGQITAANQQVVPVPAIIYFNGSTDYIEAYSYVSGGTGIVIAGTTGNAPFCYFQAMLIRSA